MASGSMTMQMGALWERLPFVRRRRTPADRREALAAIPVRNTRIAWEADTEGRVTLRVPLRPVWQDHWSGRFLRRVVALPPEKRVALDEVGSDVWQLCDGEATVEEIIRALAAKYCLNRREVEASLGIYLKTLARRRYIGLFTRGGGEVKSGRAEERTSGRAEGQGRRAEGGGPGAESGRGSGRGRPRRRKR